MRATGDCFEAAVNFVMDKCTFAENCPFVIVQAEVAGQGPLEGVSFGHAYAVDTRTNTVIDRSNGRNVMMPRDVYEMLGQINQIGNFFEYSWKEAREQMIKHEHYGPWDLKTSTGL
mgnify:FL=1